MNVEHEEVISSISNFHRDLFLAIDEIWKDPIGFKMSVEEIYQKCDNLVVYGKEIIK